jgi:ankyrin repeat protein
MGGALGLAEKNNAAPPPAKKPAEGQATLRAVAPGDLIEAVKRGDVGTVKGLLAGGADVEVHDEEGWTALTLAASEGNAEVVECLLRGGADVEAKGKDRKTAYKFASTNKHKDVTNCLLAWGALKLETDEGRTASLLRAAANGHTGAVA